VGQRPYAGRISDVLAADSLSADTRLVLVNGVYFKALWAVPFDKERTRDEPFHLEGGGEVRAPLMHQIKEAAYLQGAGYQAVALPYREADLSLLVLLPDRRDGLNRASRSNDQGVPAGSTHAPGRAFPSAFQDYLGNLRTARCSRGPGDAAAVHAAGRLFWN